MRIPVPRLKAARKAAGLSQQQLANMLEVDRKTVNRWENGQSSPSARHLRYLERYLGQPCRFTLKNAIEKIHEEARSMRLWAHGGLAIQVLEQLAREFEEAAGLSPTERQGQKRSRLPGSLA